MSVELAVAIFLGCWLFVAVVATALELDISQTIAPSDIDTDALDSNGAPIRDQGSEPISFAAVAAQNRAAEQAEVRSWRARLAAEDAKRSGG